MRSVLFSLFVLSFVFPLSGTQALIFGADDRLTVTTTPGSPFSSVGIVYGGSPGVYATAFLIDDCHALTIQHVFGKSASAKGRRTIVAFEVEGPPDSWAATRAKVVADGAIEMNGRKGITAHINDWALLRLSKCLGKTFGHVRLSARIPSPSDEIGIAGYPEDRPLSEGLSIDARCHVRAIRSLTILHDCAALPGNSGSPLFRVVRENGRTVLETFGIVEGAHSHHDLGRNVIDARDNYPDAVWNVATVICGNDSLAAARLRCRQD